MEKPFYTSDNLTVYAYLADGRVVEIEKVSQKGWPSVQIKPAQLQKEPSVMETICTALDFAAAYHCITADLLQVGQELALTPTQAVEPTPDSVEGVDFADALGEFDRNYTPGVARAIDPAAERMTREQEQQIRQLYGSQVPDIVVRRFDWRLRNAFTMETAQQHIDELLAGAERQEAA